MAKKTVKIAYSGTVPLFSARLDDRKLSFSASGKAEKPIRTGKSYPLQWFAEGAPGDTYKIEVTEPAELKFSYEETIDEGLKGAGHTWLTLKEDA